MAAADVEERADAAEVVCVHHGLRLDRREGGHSLLEDGGVGGVGGEIFEGRHAVRELPGCEGPITPDSVGERVPAPQESGKPRESRHASHGDGDRGVLSQGRGERRVGVSAGAVVREDAGARQRAHTARQGAGVRPGGRGEFLDGARAA